MSKSKRKFWPFALIPNKRLVTASSRFLMLFSGLLVLFSATTLFFGKNWFSTSASAGAQAITASVAVIITSMVFLVSLYIQSPTYQKELRIHSQLQSLQSFLISLIQKEDLKLRKPADEAARWQSTFGMESGGQLSFSNKNKYSERLKNPSFRWKDYRSGIDDGAGGGLPDPLEFKSHLEGKDLDPSKNPVFFPMLEIDLTLDGRQLELEYLFKLVTGDAGDFIYLRSHDQPADSKENNETDWSKGFDLLCRLSTGKFHVAEAVSLLDLIGQLSKKEIDEICNQILDSTHHLKYAQIINKSSLLGAYRQKKGDVPSVDVYTAFSNGDPKKVHSKFLQLLKNISTNLVHNDKNLFLGWDTFLESSFQQVLALPTLGNAEQYALTFYNFLASDQLQKEFVRKKALDFNQLGLLSKTIPDGEMKTLQSLLDDVKETGSHEDFEKYALAIYKVTNKFLYPDGVAEYVMSDQVSYHNVFSFSWFGFFDAEKNESGLTKYQVEKVEKHQKYCEDLRMRLKEARITNVDPT